MQPLPCGFSAYNWIEWIKAFTLTRIFDPRAGVWFGRFGTINGAFRTLAVEFQFYVVVALTGRRPRWRVWLLGGLTLLSLPACFWLPLFVQCVIFGAFSPFWSWFAFGLGLHSLLAHGISPGKIFGRGGAVFSSAVIVALLTVCAILVRKNVELERTSFSLGFAALLWLASDFDGFMGDLLHGKRWIPGDLGIMFLSLPAMSYSLYLVHNELARTIGGAIGRWASNPRTITDLVVVLGTISAAYPFYRLCEKPFVAEASIARGGCRPRDGFSRRTSVRFLTETPKIRLTVACPSLGEEPMSNGSP